MAIKTAEILDVIREHGVVPDDPSPGLDLPTGDGPSVPGVGEIGARNLVGALTKCYGYEKVAGGKGSHVKLKKPGAPTIRRTARRARGARKGTEMRSVGMTANGTSLPAGSHA